MIHTRYFAWAVWVLLILLIIWVASEVSFIFRGVVVLVQTLFLPVFLSGVLYYLLFPLVNYLTARRVPKSLSVLLIYLLFGSVITLLVIFLSPIVYREFVGLANDAPVLIDAVRNMLINLYSSEIFARLQGAETFSIERIAGGFSEYVGSGITLISANISLIAGFLANLLITLFIVPFILYYLLLSDSNPLKLIARVIPEQHKKEAESILSEMNNTLGQYIQGQLLVSLLVGLLVYAGLLIIGMNYALVLAVIAMFANIIPFLGTAIVLLLTLILAFLISPWMAVKAFIVIIVIQQLESLIISPKIIGKKLDMHPISIILLVLFAGRLAGIPGVVLAVPAYAIIKLVTIHFFRLSKLRKIEQ